MGTVKVDLHRKDREFNAAYALDNAEGVKFLLADYQKFVSRKRCGDYAAVEVLIDIHKAIELAGLTDRQRQAIELVYFGELTQTEAGERMGIAQKNVNEALDRASEKLVDIYYYWAGHGEGYTTGGRIDG
ncbi:RNA polymerase subunit sigma [Bacillus velezensis]|uniref:sigma factor-like helix-turn-helix DNA-binding protein n=1 Tax=Bacillus velezensis TaxID=492670 RepID=UPI000CF1828E|nr:sigma factor-like helix-turn-helix DNA-binding protein [Bacillus velezensis]MCM3276290.1 RNA polymerase subunit sigma [Bacillus velezensis]MCM3350160.1 RNA polymerase subunit sigma [Bacillus velezensis]MEC3797950.1 sigma factor-like helix-turn-helix DNA-binding protein [Bacillus velezensis]PQB09110.1 RNA polymerase subunit sigma [Bacillus velezensis]